MFNEKCVYFVVLSQKPEKEVNLTNIARCMCTYPGGYSELTGGYLRWSVFIAVFIFFLSNFASVHHHSSRQFQGVKFGDVHGV